MGRPINPTSRNQVDLRARELRDPDHGWTDLLLQTLAVGCLKAQRWKLHLEDGGEPGPLLGTFPKLPDTPGQRVRIGAEVVFLEEVGLGFQRDVGEDSHEDLQLDPSFEEVTQEVVDRLEIHVRNHLRPSFYREVASWIGDGLAQGEAEDLEGSVGPFHDIWQVPHQLVAPAAPGCLPTQLQLLLHAAAWHFARFLYRKLLDPRPDPLGRRGLERPANLRRLLEELEVLKPGGLKTQPVGEKPLARMTTHEVPMLGFRAFMREGTEWEETEDGRGRYLHERRSENGYRRWELTFQEGREDLAFASLARCRQVLEKGGLEMTALHGLLCCLVMQQEDPGARFEVRGDDLLKDLGLSRGGGEGNTRSDLLRRVASSATLLGAVRCEGNSRNRSQGMRISMEFGPMWSIAVRADGQLKLLDGPGEEQLGTVTDLTLTVTPGTWVQSQRDLATGSHLLYVPMATRVLSLGRYRQELAFRLGIHLAMGVRERRQYQGGRANVRVGQLLEEVLPKGELERAFQDRDAAYKLRNKWTAALATLQQVVGFRFEFPPDQYPPALIPEDLRPEGMEPPPPVGHGALEQLLASRLEIHWPEPVVEAIHQKALPQREREAALQVRQQQKKALQSRPNGARLKEALEKAKASGAITGRREAADRLGISVAQLSKLENGHKPLPERELQRCLALLETFRPGRS
jgi:hypothetical protein